MEPTELSFDEQLQRFRERTANHRGRFKGLILPGTGKHNITAGLLIGALEPARVAFLLTDQTRDMPQRVAQALNTSPDGWFVPEGDYSDTDTIYSGIKEVLNEWADLSPSEIAADVTGGLALMSVGIAKATHVLNLNTIYVKSDYDGKPIPGTQWLEFPPDPYTVFGDLESAEARRLYNTHDYSGAQRIFANLEERVPEPDASIYRAYATLSETYAHWDVFNWREANIAIERLLNAPLPPNIEPERSRLQKQHAMLQRLNADTARLAANKLPQSLLEDLDSILPLLGILRSNAQRRAAQGRYDMAAMFLYRCLELMSQHRLAGHGILTERPDYGAIRKRIPDLDTRYRNIERSLFRNSYGIEEGRSINLLNGYMLLKALDDSLIHDFDLKQIRNSVKARNNSMLAHGFRLIDEKEYQQFREVVDKIVTRFFQVSKHDQLAWERTSTFLTLFSTEQEPSI
jgi:CRISPR-associated protein (TIGR02710 family)